MIYFLIPVYNESANLENLHKSLTGINLYEPVFYVFADDCSTDNTIELIQKHFLPHQSHIIKNEKNNGPGFCFNQGFEWILQHSKNKNDLIITMEGDDTADYTVLPEMLKLASCYDLVLASVYVSGGNLSNTPFLRKFLSKTANFLLRKFYRLQIHTVSSFYRVYQKEMLMGIKKHYGKIIGEPGFTGKTEILLKASKLNARITEVPANLYSERSKRASNMKVVKTMLSYLKLMVNSLIGKNRF